MSVTFGFYNSLNHDRTYDAIQMSSIFDGIIKDGIFESIGDQLEVSANSGMVITVGTGRAWFDHTWTLNDSLLPLTVPDAEVVLDRIDSVILEVNADVMTRANSIYIVSGTPSSSPVHPDLIDNEDVHQYRLADIAVGAGVTEITQAEITNYIGTTDTPFITGILETMNVDMLVAQWQSEYQQMKNADHIQYQSSLNADHTAYETQRQADDALFNAWFQNKMNEVLAWYNNLQVTIDQNVAVRLQNEIGTLSLLQTETKANLVEAINELVGTSYPCFIRVTCAEEFAGDEITLSYDGNVIKSAIIPSTAPYIVEFAVKETGQYTIRETVYDISTTVNVTNYTIYNAGLYLGSIALTVDADFIGSVITCTDGSTTKTWLCDGLTHVFSVGLGTWTISGTVDGKTYETSVTVTEYREYSAELHTIPAFNYVEWLESAGIDPSGYNSLDDVLADEAALRVLFTIHASVDYLSDSATGAALDDVETIINNDYCAKWINAKNYALDKLYSNESIAALMDTADKYFYGQWAYDSTTETWGPVGAVPKMTSNTTPYGQCDGNGIYLPMNDYFKAFDGDDTTWFNANTATIGKYISYSFVTPICIKRVYGHTQNGGTKWGSITVKGSNDGITWTDIYTFDASGKDSFEETFENTSYYLKYSMVSNSAVDFQFATLQFYGRQLDVSVPKMTSNTTPSGEAFADSKQLGNDYYNLFDDVDEPYWNTQNYSGNLPESVGFGYDFGHGGISPRLTMLQNVNRSVVIAEYIKTFKIQASNDKVNWTDLTDVITKTNFAASGKEFYDTFTLDAYRYFRILTLSNNGSPNYFGCCGALQFYGLNYSESIEYDIYSAAADTVFYYPGGDTSGSPVVLCTTDNTGHGKAIISLSEGTSITLYSTVAKDTETGTGNYSKNIDLSNSIHGIYVMPDITYYWYGYKAMMADATKTGDGTVTYNTNTVDLFANANALTGKHTGNLDIVTDANIDLTSANTIFARYSADRAGNTNDGNISYNNLGLDTRSQAISDGQPNSKIGIHVHANINGYVTGETLYAKDAEDNILGQITYSVSFNGKQICGDTVHLHALWLE